MRCGMPLCKKAPPGCVVGAASPPCVRVARESSVQCSVCRVTGERSCRPVSFGRILEAEVGA